MTTILFATNEDTGLTFIAGSAPFVLGPNTPALTRSDFSGAPWCIDGLTRLSATLPPTNYILTAPFTAPASSFWVHARFGQNAVSGSTNTLLNMPALWLYDGAGVLRLALRGAGTASQYKLTKRNAAGTLTDIATSATGCMPIGEMTVRTVAIDWFVNYGNSGQSQLYINGVLVFDSGVLDLTTDGATTLARLGLQSMTSPGLATIGWSEFIVQDTDTRGLGLWSLRPAASGVNQTWLPDNVFNIDEPSINDADRVGTATNNALSGWQPALNVPAGNWAIHGVIQEARVSKGTTGPQHFEWYIRTADGTDHTTGSVAPTTSLANYRTIWTVNPVTGTDWTLSDFVPGFNYGIGSLT